MNVEKRWRTNASLAATLICIALAGRADAAVVSYTIDPLRSSLTLSGDLGGTPLFPQGPGAEVDSYHGAIVGDLVAGVLTFSGGSTIIADSSAGGPFLPAVGGTVDNYGMETTTGFYGLGYLFPRDRLRSATWLSTSLRAHFRTACSPHLSTFRSPEPSHLLILAQTRSAATVSGIRSARRD